MNKFLPFVRGDRGQSIVELALALPILVFLLIGGSDLARAFAVQIAVQNGARAGAEASAITFTPTAPEAVAWTSSARQTATVIGPAIGGARYLFGAVPYCVCLARFFTVSVAITRLGTRSILQHAPQRDLTAFSV